MSKKRVSYKLYLGRDPATGKRKYKSFTADTKREARRMADAYDPRDEEKRNTLTVRQAIEKYADDREAILSPTSINSIRGCARNYFQDIMDLPISEITIPILQSSVNEQVKVRSDQTHKTLSPRTVKNNFSTLTSALKYADIDLPYYKIKLPQRAKIHYHTPDQSRLREILRVSYGTPLEIPILLASWLSLRRGEICGLTWDDIDGDILHIRKTRIIANNKEYIKSPKNTESDRDIYLPEYIKKRIYATKGCYATHSNKRYVARNKEYIVPCNPNVLTKNFGVFLAQNNLPHCRFHDLRHAFASISHSIGVPDRYVEAIGGWSDDTTLKKVYQQTFREDLLSYSRQIETAYSALIPQN
jgi:integrase